MRERVLGGLPKRSQHAPTTWPERNNQTAQHQVYLLSFHYLNHAWGVGKNFMRKLEKDSEAPPVATKQCNNPSR